MKEPIWFIIGFCALALAALGGASLRSEGYKASPTKAWTLYQESKFQEWETRQRISLDTEIAKRKKELPKEE